METTLNKIQIKGFKSIKEMDIVLKPINIIVGQNGAGKSNFIKIFELLNNIYSENLQKYLLSEGRADRFLFFGSKVTQEINIVLTLKQQNI